MKAQIPLTIHRQLWIPRCNDRGMTGLAMGSQAEKTRSLIAELRAIEVWDAGYWGSNCHAEWETLAMLNRGERRAEIL